MGLRERLPPLRRAVAMAWAAAPGWTVAGAALVVAQGLLPLVLLGLSKVTIDAVASALATPDPLSAYPGVIGWTAATAAVAIGLGALRAGADAVREHQARCVADHVIGLIQEKSAELDLAYYEDARYHDTLFRAQTDAPWRPARVVQSLFAIAQGGVALAALAGLLLWLHWGVAVALLVASLPGVAARFRHARRQHTWQVENTGAERQAWEYHRLLTGPGAAREVRAFELSRLFRERHRLLRERLGADRLRLGAARAAADLLAQATAAVALFGVLAWLAWRTLAGALTLGDMAMYAQAVQRVHSSLQEIFGGLARLDEDGLFLAHLEELLALEARVEAPAHPRPVPRPIRSGLSVEGVSFRYPGAIRDALVDVTFSIGPGEVVALVGDNGSGKTTLATLLCRLHDPSRGRIAVDGVDLRDLAPLEWRRELSVVFQDLVHYPLTLRENVVVGAVSGLAAPGGVEGALERAGAGGLASRLRGGLEAPLGPHLQGGVDLSAGEWQQVAVARALARDARLLVLDEPTSSLSARAERKVVASLRETLGDRFALVVSHKVGTIRDADRICVLAGGRIVEQGTHEELVRMDGRYARLFLGQQVGEPS